MKKEKSIVKVKNTPKKVKTTYEKHKKYIETRVERVNRFKKLIVKDKKYPTAESIINVINEYFEGITDVSKSTKKLTIAGLSRHIGFKKRVSLINYPDDELYSDIIQYAVLMIEEYYELKLVNSNPGGAIFALKNFGWQDTSKSEVNVSLHPFIELMKKQGDNGN